MRRKRQILTFIILVISLTAIGIVIDDRSLAMWGRHLNNNHFVLIILLIANISRLVISNFTSTNAGAQWQFPLSLLFNIIILVFSVYHLLSSIPMSLLSQAWTGASRPTSLKFLFWLNIAICILAIIDVRVEREMKEESKTK